MLNYVRQFFKIRLVFRTLYLWNDEGDLQLRSLLTALSPKMEQRQKTQPLYLPMLNPFIVGTGQDKQYRYFLSQVLPKNV